ncbi:UDP-N-acetylenolpyruvoylglucosamine reductase [Gloeomargarita lithophora Alchichica-D10]|uniref:UDP-N-acetylenolpyruvoylglucosamine reductase n=1 Tax=Gloeomargarita lithophora Alchichica-D10 TaxID=1188229 RepID=A0A1J0AFV8_9CYAN|nr:UDP-N-acetylmuramate dehydrogenase [Gloeomargarita lithophora]APB34805.1 UDP-N-acetylenolpyruvoylglucosamine reductase [Gloeomargarita lithophora Alchichica-D10]
MTPTELCREQAALAELTTYRVGGRAQWLAVPRCQDELLTVVAWANQQHLPVTVVGAGSNLLISDRGLTGLVLCTRYLRGVQWDETTGQMTAAAGMPLPQLAWDAARRGWHGLAWAVGIPGTVGGAVVMNAGAQGGCTADYLVAAQVWREGAITTCTTAELAYGYRASSLQISKGLVLSARWQCTPGHDPQLLLQQTSEYLHHRRSTQPYHLPSCGSVFRNPVQYKAGWLIEQSGLKGYQIGQAQVSPLHANFMVNLGGATAQNIYDLIHHVQAVVAEQWGIELHPEVKFLGEFSHRPV